MYKEEQFISGAFATFALSIFIIPAQRMLSCLCFVLFLTASRRTTSVFLAFILQVIDSVMSFALSSCVLSFLTLNIFLGPSHLWQ